MELTKFCPRCGKETDRLYGDKKKLCAECYPEVHDLLEVPDKVEIEVCPVCGRMKKSGEWLEEYTIEEQLLAKFAEFAEPEVETEIQFWEEDGQTFVRLHAFKGEMSAFYDTRVDFVQQQCRDCSRFQGGFFKVKLQLRGETDLDPIADKIVDVAAEATNEDRKDFLSNVERTSHGFDFYMSTEKIAKKVLRTLRSEYNPEIKRSYELIGEKDGEELYRNVISVRIE